MPVVDCTLREVLRLGRGIHVHLTARVDDALYIYIDAASKHVLGGGGGFCASASSGIGRCAHVLMLCDGQSFTIGSFGITIEAVRLHIPGAVPLRDVRLWVEASTTPLCIGRKSPPRPRRPMRRGAEEVSCWF